MTDVKRIRELAGIVENMWCNGSVHEPTARAIKEALDELARIKGAALSVPEIEERAQRRTGVILTEKYVREAIKVLESDRATLLDALRARGTEFLAYWQRCKDVLGEERVGGRPIADCIADLMQERDDTRAQLAQAQKEIEQERKMAAVRAKSLEDSEDELRRRTEAFIRVRSQRDALQEQLFLSRHRSAMRSSQRTRWPSLQRSVRSLEMNSPSSPLGAVSTRSNRRHSRRHEGLGRIAFVGSLLDDPLRSSRLSRR